MTEIGYFFDGISYSEAAQADFQAHALRPDGIMQDSAYGALNITATNGNMSVTLRPGEAMIQGFYYRNDANKILSIAANGSGSPRVDRIILGVDRAANTISVYVRTGTPAAGTPVLLQSPTAVYEINLALVNVASAATSITIVNLVTSYSNSVLDVRAIGRASGRVQVQWTSGTVAMSANNIATSTTYTASNPPVLHIVFTIPLPSIFYFPLVCVTSESPGASPQTQFLYVTNISTTGFDIVFISNGIKDIFMILVVGGEHS